MKVLVIGRGGREHAICKKLAESESVTEVFCAPGNAGISSVATNLPYNESDVNDLIAFAKIEHIAYTFVGPENPLLDGIVNRFQEEGLHIFGPTKEAAIIEGSKSFSKELMKKYNIPTAKYEVFTSVEKAIEYVKEVGAPIVVKADGLAAGKGVVVAETEEEAISALEEMLLDEKFGDASSKVVVEECLFGEEFSLMAFVHGESVYPMVIAQDHKRAFDGDQGPNTGGMGAYSPVPHISDDVVKEAISTVLHPTAKAMVKENRSFTGILYAGLMLTSEGPKVIEFNARFGDPETQVVLPRLTSDFGLVVKNMIEGNPVQLEWSQEAVLGVVLAADGYPGEYAKGIALPNLEESLDEETLVYHAGTEQNTEAALVSTGGRVLLVASSAPSVEKAQAKVYKELDKVDWNGLFYRRDIGKKAIEHVSS
ncbi:phosphoribosylamine--glycine ligase [Rossellomorea aquimaris]|jgi:phosphoribosylamine---glycine ligase|uniref:Phosphoribosylamine--glycine ligase n=1 Tax=Rossellomorea aquimaris TaxID=189382 RepID=A0A5D4U1S0_9BACI|nr:phosphoribosylamine--glycine ligase [Rossellomorea aquimaris]TYS81265.1 phosphoribosylamine--glycine ligase [Rossellomorea aquimaris]TYS87887.1 phosphoribosylamine--glycine ligase [Rossellomorea aquimaris]